jgi:hypothetical protein
MAAAMAVATTAATALAVYAVIKRTSREMEEMKQEADMRTLMEATREANAKNEVNVS